MSIFSLCKESRQFETIHKSEVVLCTYPGHPTYKKNDLFENNERVYSFQEVVELYPKLDSLLIHLPELALGFFYDGIAKYESYLKAVPDFRINIMNQNIKYMPAQDVVASLYKYTRRITQTTAHDRYANQEMCDKYGMPLHHLSVFIDSNQYVRTKFKDKADIIAYSRDKHPSKDKIIETMHAGLKDYELVEIDNLSYEEYKALMRKAKFIITFGEGLDGYLIEGIFSGGITFAAYNDDFFPSDFKKYPNIYKDYQAMLDNICTDIKRLNNESDYYKLNELMFKRLETLYSFKKYINNLGEFYKGNYTFLPSSDSLEKFFIESIRLKDAVIEADASALDEKDARISQFESNVQDLVHKSQQQDRLLSEIYESKSWEVTKPLRIANRLARKFIGRK